MMVVSGSMMLPVSQAPSICAGGASSSHHKKFENSLSTEEEDLVPAMGVELVWPSLAISPDIGLSGKLRDTS
ncbi:hypothetical protein F2Q69_00049443 [Brassica cretica]|uniref:Uncharacterized protein n=1 Tax=Brassica cretica TaxID=69181 RepID=A0A8S9PXP6_BRACR|nr:hypothetical protein F2Q69_00049443 [Brassica cretica]